MVVTIIIGLVVLSVILLSHELGHFISAKATGVKVEEFGLGFPPRLISFKWGETRYSLNAIPFGGFNKLTGEEDPKDPRSLAGKKRGVRLLILSAGSLMNILLALILFSVSYMIPYEVMSGQIIVEEVAPNSPAAIANIEAEDIILSVNDQSTRNNIELQQQIMVNLGKDISLLIQHPDSTQESVHLVPRWEPPEGEGAIGVSIKTINATTIIQRYPLWQVVPLGAARLVKTVGLWVDGLVSMFSGKVSTSVIGPVGLVQLSGEAAQFGIIPLLEIAALISLILGIMNLLPLPAIDGGRITFLFLEWVRRGKRISPKREGIIHAIGFALLLVASIAFAYQDIIRIINGESLLP